jgi:hypothetical protein
MRVLEGVSAFPSMLLAMTLAAVLGSGVDKVIAAITIVSVPDVAKIVRSQVLSIRESEHVESARAIGAHDIRILFRYILPLCMSPLIIRVTSSMASAIDCPMPLSSPSEVPRAFVHPSSTEASMGEFKGSLMPTPTISMWFRSTMGSASSWPGGVGLLMTMQFSASRL